MNQNNKRKGDDVDEILRVRQSRKHRSQKFRIEWCKDKELGEWLIQDKEDEYKAKFKYCNVSMVSELSNIKVHGKGVKHKQIVSSLSTKSTNQQSMTAYVKKDICNVLKTNVQRAEIKIAAFVAEHNLSFVATDHMTDMIKECFHDSEIAKNMAMKRTKTTAIVKNVIAKAHKEDLANTLRTTKFSILTDESTDIGTMKSSCIVVRFFDDTSCQIESKFWDLHEVYDSISPGLATAENLFTNLMNSFNKHNIPKSNIIGFGSDGCNVMMGHKNSVASRFRLECPGKNILIVQLNFISIIYIYIYIYIY
ncbi:Uncharacterized protein FWK35_00037269, partial [Aphis craccivora]